MGANYRGTPEGRRQITRAHFEVRWGADYRDTREEGQRHLTRLGRWTGPQSPTSIYVKEECKENFCLCLFLVLTILDLENTGAKMF